MCKYTILSFVFGNYDLIRIPKKVDPDAEYIMVTDRNVITSVWHITIDKSLANKNPIYSSYYVRWHPFKYATTDTVFIVDASIQFNDSIREIYNDFQLSPAVYALMCTNYTNDEEKLVQWHTQRNDLDDDEFNNISALIKKLKLSNQRGSIGNAFIGVKQTDTICHFQKHVWRYLIALGRYGIPNRQDEIVAHKLLNRYLNKIVLFPVSIQIIQSSFMSYCSHQSKFPKPSRVNYDHLYYLCGIPVSPIRYDANKNYPKTYKYNTEAILLTKYLNPPDLFEWLNYHINKIGFDHIQVFDNESTYDVKEICDHFGDAVSYQKIYGTPRQYKIYDAYINAFSVAKWVMPIDDDEYVQIDGFNSIYDAICYYESKFSHLMILGVRWKHLFPKKFHTERKTNVLDYCTECNPEYANMFSLGDSGIKCIVRRYGDVHYEETWENPNGGHIPKHSSFLGATLCDGQNILGCSVPDCPGELPDERIRLLHCRYKGYSEYTRKMKEVVTVSDATPRKKHFKFDDILETLG